MSCVHYKFKSSLDYDTVTFDGLNISLEELKKAIILQKKLGKNPEFDLQVINAQSQEEYTKDDAQIPKNASVIVARVPVGQMISGDARNMAGSYRNPMSFERLKETPDLVTANASEEDKISAAMVQSTQMYDPSNYMKPSNQTGPPPTGYVCFKCRMPGHFIQNCPHKNDPAYDRMIRKTTGIPSTFLLPANANTPGVLLTQSGQLAVPALHAQAYQEGKKEKPPFVKSSSPERRLSEERSVPAELLCPLCKDILTDATVIPCCGNSFCDECIREELLKTEDHICPSCGESGISPDGLIANKFLRNAVTNFRNDTGYTKESKKKPSVPHHHSQPQAYEAQRAIPTRGGDVAHHNTLPRTQYENHSIPPTFIHPNDQATPVSTEQRIPYPPVQQLHVDLHPNENSPVPLQQNMPATAYNQQGPPVMPRNFHQGLVPAGPPAEYQRWPTPPHGGMAAPGHVSSYNHPAPAPGPPLMSVAISHMPRVHGQVMPVGPTPSNFGPPPGPMPIGPAHNVGPLPAHIRGPVQPAMPGHRHIPPVRQPPARFAPRAGPPRPPRPRPPLSEREFYEEQERLQYHEGRRPLKPDPIDDFARELIEYQQLRQRRSRSRSTSRSRRSKFSSRSSSLSTRSKSRTPRSRSRTRSRSRQPPPRSRSRSRSRSPRPRPKRSRSFTRSHSRSRTPSRRRSRSGSFRLPPRRFSRSRSRSRSKTRSRTRSRSRSRPRSPLVHKKPLRYSPQRFSRSRSRSPSPYQRPRSPIQLPNYGFRGRSPYRRSPPSPYGRRGWPPGQYHRPYRSPPPGPEGRFPSGPSHFSPERYRRGYHPPPQKFDFYRYDPRWVEYYRDLQRDYFDRYGPEAPQWGAHWSAPLSPRRVADRSPHPESPARLASPPVERRDRDKVRDHRALREKKHEKDEKDYDKNKKHPDKTKKRPDDKDLKNSKDCQPDKHKREHKIRTRGSKEYQTVKRAQQESLAKQDSKSRTKLEELYDGPPGVSPERPPVVSEKTGNVPAVSTDHMDSNHDTSDKSPSKSRKTKKVKKEKKDRGHKRKKEEKDVDNTTKFEQNDTQTKPATKKLKKKKVPTATLR